MTLKETLLSTGLLYLKANGISEVSDDMLLARLDISKATFYNYFKNKEDFLYQAITWEQDFQKARDVQVQADSANAAQELLLLISLGIQDLKLISPSYLRDIIKVYPKAMEMSNSHMQAYSYPHTLSILARGIEEGVFLKSINIEVVAKVIIAEIGILLNTEMFPPEKVRIEEVFRCIYLYYVRGLCTAAAMKYTEEFFGVD